MTDKEVEKQAPLNIPHWMQVIVDVEKEAKPGPWYADDDSCDCGDGYGCSHGSWVHRIWRSSETPDPKWKNPEIYQLTNGKYQISVIDDMCGDVPDGDFLARSRMDIPVLLQTISELRNAVEFAQVCSDEKSVKERLQAALDFNPVSEEHKHDYMTRNELDDLMYKDYINEELIPEDVEI